jgi:hypothetical protein
MRRLLAALLLLPALAWGGENTAQRFFENNAGLVDRISPLLRPENSASEIINVTLDDRGQISKRKGYTQNNNTVLGTTEPVTGMGYHQAASGTSFFTVVVGTHVYRTGNTFGGGYTQVTGTITVTAGMTNLAQTTSFRDYRVVCNESDRPFKVGSSGNGFMLMQASTGAKTCESYGNYLLLANTSEGGVSYPSRLRWSDVNNIETWPANNYWDVESDDGDSIVAIKQFEDKLLIFKKNSIHQALITGSAGAEAFIVRPLARGIGAWAKNSVKVIDNAGVVFLGPNGVYLFDGEQFTLISDPIQRKIDTINRSRYSQAVGDIYRSRNQYWLSVSTGTETNNGVVLVYDYAQNAWTTYEGIDANAMAVAEDSNGNVVLLTGDYGGNVYKQDTGTSDNPAGVATAISASYSTPDLHFGIPEVEKTFKYLYVFTVIDATTTVTINAYYDYQTELIGTHSISLGQSGAVWGTAIWGSAIWPATQYKVSRIELNRHGRSIKLNFSNDDSNASLGVLGWVIVYSAEDWRN